MLNTLIQCMYCVYNIDDCPNGKFIQTLSVVVQCLSQYYFEPWNIIIIIGRLKIDNFITTKIILQG